MRSEIRTYNILNDTRHVEINNPFQNRLPNMVIVGLVESAAFNGDIGKYPFSFKTFNLSSIKQLVRGESYPYEELELVTPAPVKTTEATDNSFKPRDVSARVEATW